MYAAWTSVRRFCSFSPFCCFVESITCASSTLLVVRSPRPLPTILLIGRHLERNPRGALNLERVARKFRLTRRERETVDLLLQDLNTKQIASRMDISPNTAKVFLRSVMIKVGAENRTGIIGRILQASKSVNEGTSP